MNKEFEKLEAKNWSLFEKEVDFLFTLPSSQRGLFCSVLFHYAEMYIQFLNSHFPHALEDPYAQRIHFAHEVKNQIRYEDFLSVLNQIQAYTKKEVS